MVTALAVGSAMVVTLLAVLVIGLLRSHAEILRALHDLGVNFEDGAPATSRHERRPPDRSPGSARTADGVPGPRGGGAPLGRATDITGTLPHGGAARVAVTGVDHSTLLAFLSTGCGTCGVFWEALQDVDARELPGTDTRVVIVTGGIESESVAAVADLEPHGLVTVMSAGAWDDYEIPVAPYFVLTDGRSGRIVGEGAGTSWAQITGLLGRVVADARPPRTQVKSSLHRMGGQDRADWVDGELLAAGLEPGDASLYRPAHPSHLVDDDEPRR